MTAARDDGVVSEVAVTTDAFLGDALEVLQPRSGYRAGIDAVLLAASAPIGPEAKARVLDAGAGVGTVGLCVARRLPLTEVSLLEQQPVLAGLARRNTVSNGLAERVQVIEADITAQPAALAALGLVPDMFDVVLVNPPYHAEGQGTASADPVKAAAHAMPAAALELWTKALVRVCRPGGSIVMIHRAESLDLVLAALGRRFGGLDILPVHPRRGEPANRILVRGTKGSRAPLRLLPGFIVHADDGAYTNEAEAILRRGAALPFAPRNSRPG